MDKKDSTKLTIGGPPIENPLNDSIAYINSNIIQELIHKEYPNLSNEKESSVNSFNHKDGIVVLFNNHNGYIKFSCSEQGKISCWGHREFDREHISPFFNERPSREELIKIIRFLKQK